MLADNVRAIGAYEKIGFVSVARVPLMREPIAGGYRLVPATAETGVGVAELVRMELPRQRFLEHASWSAG